MKQPRLSPPVIRCAWFGIGLVALGMLSGCIIPLAGFHPAGSRHNVTAGVQSKLHPGVTTLEEVILLLGEPDSSLSDGEEIRYEWVRIYALGDSGAPLSRKYILTIDFDVSNRVSSVQLDKKWK